MFFAISSGGIRGGVRGVRPPKIRKASVGKPRTDSVPPTMQSQIPKSRGNIVKKKNKKIKGAT